MNLINLFRFSVFTITVCFLMLTVACSPNIGFTYIDPAFAPAKPMPAKFLASDTSLTRIALGSCFHPSMDSNVFGSITRNAPGVMVLLGDNVYAEDESDDKELKSLRNAYGALAEVKSFQQLRQQIPLLVTWDDHDFGKNDSGHEFSERQFAESLFEYAWAIPQSDPRRQREGVYFERTVGAVGEQVQFIVLDTRSFRSALTLNPDQGIGRYTASTDPQQTVLGESQWVWLEEQLNKPADLRILVTSIQLIAEGHYWEAWAMMPKERQRLYDIVNQTQANGIVIVSGDRHSAAIYREPSAIRYPLYEMTTSSLNIPLTSFVKNPSIEPGPLRMGRPYFDANFGLIDINWNTREVVMKLMDPSNHLIREQSIALDDLRVRRSNLNLY